jgi:hypothetical protein
MPHKKLMILRQIGNASDGILLPANHFNFIEIFNTIKTSADLITFLDYIIEAVSLDLFFRNNFKESILFVSFPPGLKQLI